ncbi:MAG: DUF3048 domain-containing protein [Lachnospiraceae bacterium]|nr:DUF3048 domain-containing protein [Lachnospiraceae bacterium]
MKKLIKNKKALPLLLNALILFCLASCGEKTEDVPAQELPSATTEALTPTKAPASPDKEAVTDTPPAENMVRSRLTNEWVDKDVSENRPIAVMIPNEANAIPQYSLSHASILYEAPVEGSMTRLMAIYEDWTDIKKIGNVRSTRLYYMPWAFEWDAVICHVHGPFFIDETLADPHTQTIDYLSATGSEAFYRDDSKRSPHNVYTSGELLKKAFDADGYEAAYRNEISYRDHFIFASPRNPNTLDDYGNSRTAAYIDMTNAYPLTRCYFEYNDKDGLYYRYQHLSGGEDGPHIDGENGEQLKFANVIVQTFDITEALPGSEYLYMNDIDSNQNGWYFTKGKGIPVTWEKTDDYGATKFYDLDGNEIVLNTGKTMICVIDNKTDVSFS